ncbi:MAG: Chromate resistance protein ChrB [Solirubrobacteraceae bacterium]
MRVAVWRELRRIGALPLQQAVVALPTQGGMSEKLGPIAERVRGQGGVVYTFPLDGLDAADDARLRAEWDALRTLEYEEIVEECETKFEREIELEVLRENFTAAEAEEIEADLEKIRGWFDRVRDRDVFAVSACERAENAIARCERLLDDFVQRVYDAETERGPSLQPPTVEPLSARRPSCG